MSWRENHFYGGGKEKSNEGRVNFLALFFVIIAGLIVFRLFTLQVLRGGFYAALAMGQHELYQKLFPERGSIYVMENAGGRQSLFPLVANSELNLLYAVPSEIAAATTTAEKLFEILGLPEKPEMKKVEEELFKDISPTLDPKMAEEIKAARLVKWEEDQKLAEINRLSSLMSAVNFHYKPLRHKLTDEQTEKITALDIKGLGFQKETWRFYPEKGMGGQILGFLGFDGDKRQGKYGLEGYYDEELTGKFGEIRSERDVWGNIITVGNNFFKEKEDGSDLVLTIDRAIQYKACQALYGAMEKFKAEGGAIIAMNPKTGAIIAMCGAPDFDPNEYNKVDDINVYNNPGIAYSYEPGSIFKPITMAAALDAGKVEPQTTFEDTGQVQIGPDTMKNFEDKVYGKSTMTEVLENSINTGAIYAMRAATPKVFTQYVKNFGFGEITGIGLDKEATGDINNLERKGEIYAATASFGQGITATPLQMLTAFGGMVNDGKMMKPYIVSQLIRHQGEKKEIQNFYPQMESQVISPKTSIMIKAMMVSVVESGHAKLAGVAGYRVGGKTGTAQVANKSGRGYSGKVNTSFVGFAPFNDPQFVMIVALFEPESGREAAINAAPVFSDVAKFILQYYNVPHDK